MRQSIALCLVVGMALTACSKKDEAREASMPPAAGATQAAPQTAAAVPSQTVPVAQQPTAAAPVQQPAGAASIVQPLRNDTIIVTQQYACKNDTSFTARFMHNPSQVEITFPGRMPVTMPKTSTGSGFAYKTSAYQLIGQGSQAQWTINGRAPVDCSVAKR